MAAVRLTNGNAALGPIPAVPRQTRVTRSSEVRRHDVAAHPQRHGLLDVGGRGLAYQQNRLQRCRGAGALAGWVGVCSNAGDG